MIDLLEKAYSLMEKNNFKESLEIYSDIFYSRIDNAEYVEVKYRAIKECFILSKQYSPAMLVLLSYKDDLLNNLPQDGTIDRTKLICYSEICYLTKNDNEFLTLFSDICFNNKEIAESVYSLVEKILIENKRWDLCNLCINDATSYSDKILEQYDELIKISEENFDGEYNEIYKKEFCKKLQTIFWILKVGKRDKEKEKLIPYIEKKLQDRHIECNDVS